MVVEVAAVAESLDLAPVRQRRRHPRLNRLRVLEHLKVDKLSQIKTLVDAS